MTVLQPQSLEKKESQHKSSQAHIPTSWSLLYAQNAVEASMTANGMVPI